MTTYKIVRHYRDHDSEIVREGLTLDEVRAHCRDPESSSNTCTSDEGRQRTADRGPWFDGYTEE